MKNIYFFLVGSFSILLSNCAIKQESKLGSEEVFDDGKTIYVYPQEYELPPDMDFLEMLEQACRSSK